MSNRERWVVYPLLMLALGASLRSKFTGELNVDRLHCQSVIVGERNAARRIILNSLDPRTAMEVLGRDDQPVILLESDANRGLLSIAGGRGLATNFGLSPDGSVLSASVRQGSKLYHIPIYRLPTVGRSPQSAKESAKAPNSPAQRGAKTTPASPAKGSSENAAKTKSPGSD